MLVMAVAREGQNSATRGTIQVFHVGTGALSPELEPGMVDFIFTARMNLFKGNKFAEVADCPRVHSRHVAGSLAPGVGFSSGDVGYTGILMVGLNTHCCFRNLYLRRR